MKQEEIQRINQLARKYREEGLTEEERREQKRLRKPVIQPFKVRTDCKGQSGDPRKISSHLH